MPDAFGRSPEPEQPLTDVEQVLSAYYGPPLDEQPLPPRTWMQLQQQLKRPWYQPAWLARGRRPVRSAPMYIQEAYVEVARSADIRWRVPAPRLRYRLVRRGDLPTIRIAFLLPRAIRLTDVRGRQRILDQVELDVLLAGGLARYLLNRRPVNQLLSWLLCLLAAGAILSSIVLGWQQQLAWSLGLALLSACMFVLIHSYQRWLTFQADARVVSWLGRERTCEGLQGLASRSRHSRRPGWGTPSLAARARRICIHGVPGQRGVADRGPLLPISK
ncbi:hypothetical protein KDW_60340 [Dictyobacter vulcani]|uniref:Uncharacterized protein n=1 Tax=Dictyobacter vulcani TaxID=2607529 RepID=A0A5J4KXS8_9CHLR|nr:hypothetical protein [Dictyobacter vulcani]GER91872.1 hypothetical protein KDW_60340 [Dictyobacter vulcani]